MALQWPILEQQGRDQEHPTLESVIQVLRALEHLGDKPESQPQANLQLQHAAELAAALGSREKTELKEASLLKKAKRLDDCLGTGISQIFRDWLDKNVKPHEWRDTRYRFRHDHQALVNIAESYQRAIRILADKPRPIEIRILTTRLLDARFWPSVLQAFFEKNGTDGPHNVHVNLSTIEPHRVLDMAGEEPDHDLLVTYGNATRFARDSRFSEKHIQLHTCLLGSAGKLPEGQSLREILRRERIAVLHAHDQILRNFPWGDVAEVASDRTDFRSTTLAIHAYCRSGCGVGVSHLEFLDELEQKELDTLTLNPDQFGSSALICLRPLTRAPHSEPRSDQASACIALLEQIVHERFEKIHTEYVRAEALTRQLREFEWSYSTATVYPLQRGRPVHFEAWRGRMSLQVTASLFVHGVAQIFGDSRKPSRPELQSFRLFGRIRFPQDAQHGQIVLRAMNRDNNEISMLSFVIEEADGQLRCPGLREPCLIGHWIGKESNRDYIAPNAGVLIWHQRPDLSERRLTELIAKYRARYPISILPEAIHSVLGKIEEQLH